MRRIVMWDVAGDRSERFRHRSGRLRCGLWSGGELDRTTVWNCGQSESRLGGWLPDVVARAVTRYSMPGDRALLVSDASVAYGGLHDTAWTVIRLGRHVRTQNLLGCKETGVGLGIEERFKVVIVAAVPESVGMVRLTRLGEALVPDGALVVVTHAEWGGRWLCDPSGSLVRVAAENRLRFVDHVVVQQEPEGGGARVQGYVDVYVFGLRELG